MIWRRKTEAEQQKAANIFTVIFAELTALRDKNYLVMLSEQQGDDTVYNIYDKKDRLIMRIIVGKEDVLLSMLAYAE